METALFLLLTICTPDGLSCETWQAEKWESKTAQEAAKDWNDCNNMGLAHYTKDFPDQVVKTLSTITDEKQ